jgi:hypothetical protein
MILSPKSFRLKGSLSPPLWKTKKFLGFYMSGILLTRLQLDSNLQAMLQEYNKRNCANNMADIQEHISNSSMVHQSLDNMIWRTYNFLHHH